VLKTVYRSSCRDKHNCQRRDSNLDPLTPQSDALTARPLRPAMYINYIHQSKQTYTVPNVSNVVKVLFLCLQLLYLNKPAFLLCTKGKGSPYSIGERSVPELILVLDSQSVGDVSHKPGGRLPLLSARPAVTLATFKRAATNLTA